MLISQPYSGRSKHFKKTTWYTESMTVVEQSNMLFVMMTVFAVWKITTFISCVLNAKKPIA